MRAGPAGTVPCAPWAALRRAALKTTLKFNSTIYLNNSRHFVGLVPESWNSWIKADQIVDETCRNS